jgi:RES domain
VGIAHPYEIEHEERVRRGERLYGKRLSEFSRHIQDYPYLGSAHPVGRKILRDMPRFPRMPVSESSWFRARRVKNARRYSLHDLRPPNPNDVRIPDGRFNHSSKAHWYLASDSQAAIMEVIAESDAFAWVQEWRIERLENVLDLRAWDADGVRGFVDGSEGPTDAPLLAIALIFSDHLTSPVQERTRQPEYIVPRFVADAARQAGYSGILFSSAKHIFNNLVIFDPETPLIAVGEPKLMETSRDRGRPSSANGSEVLERDIGPSLRKIF